MNTIKELHDSFQDTKVLYVEDENELREETLLFLKRIFQNIDSAKDGQEGLELFNQHNYDFVISDLKMPKMDGREMLNKIHELNKETVLMVMTASDSNIDATQTTCDAYMHKPVSFVDFFQELEVLKNKILSKKST